MEERRRRLPTTVLPTAWVLVVLAVLLSSSSIVVPVPATRGAAGPSGAAQAGPPSTDRDAGAAAKLVGCHVSESCPAAPGPSSSAKNWTNLTSVLSASPPADVGSLAYDAHDNYTLYYSRGYTATYRAGVWTPLPSAGYPMGGSDLGAMAYDAADGYVVLYGGYNGVTWGDTWIFQNGTWTWWEQYKSGSTCYTDPPTDTITGFCPGPLYDGTMVYDVADGYLILDGSWKFSSGAWSALNSSMGGVRSMTYDAGDGYVLATDNAGGTYTYRAGVWTTLSTPYHPSSRELASLAYDPAGNFTLLFGGTRTAWGGKPYFNDAWDYSAGNWTNVTSPGGPSPRALAAITYDVADGYLLLFGGYSSGQYGWVYSNETWMYSQGLVTSAVVRPSTVDAGHPATFFGSWSGSPIPSSVEWSFGDGSTSSVAATSHSYATPGTYQATFYANSSTNSTSVNSTVTVTVVPALGGLSVAATPNPTDIRVAVHFSESFTGGVAPFNSTWTSGASDSIVDLVASTFTYFTPGTYRLGVNVTDAVGVSQLASVNVTVNAGPSSGSIYSSVNATDVGVPVSFFLVPTGGTAPYSYSWQFGVPGGSANGSSSSASYAYSAPGEYLVTAWANDSVGGSSTSSMTVVVSPLPGVSIDLAPSPADAAAPVRFAANSTGGTGPFAALWTFGDGSSSTLVAPSHSYASPGNYNVSVQWTDSVGQSAFANSTLQVGPALSVALYVSNLTPALGQSVLFIANVSGGHSPFVYVWSELPPGCVSINQSRIGCLPTQAGSYPARVNVTDAYSGTATTAANVTVIFDFTVAVTSGAFVGEPLSIAVTPEGGIGTLHYGYTGLPTGCVTADVRNLTCVPTRSGQFQVGITVTDEAFDSAHHDVPVDVGVPAGASTTGQFGPIVPWIVVGAVGALVVVAVGIWWSRRPAPPP